MNLTSIFESSDVEDPCSVGSGDGPANSATHSLCPLPKYVAQQEMHLATRYKTCLPLDVFRLVV